MCFLDIIDRKYKLICKDKVHAVDMLHVMGGIPETSLWFNDAI